MSNSDRLTEAKIKLARRGAAPSAPSADARVPPGQTVVTNFPVLDLGIHRIIPLHRWKLTVSGRVEQPLELDWESFSALPQTDIVIDFHCVTRWSRLDMPWRGVRPKVVLERARLLPNASHVVLHCHDGYTTNLPIEALFDDEVLLAHSVFGKPLTREHGGPVRMLVPSRYAWKSAKWIKAIEILDHDAPGFWEVRGYHNDADPRKEQRFG